MTTNIYYIDGVCTGCGKHEIWCGCNSTHYPAEQWPELYCDFLNNFLTLERFAEYYEMSEEHAEDIIQAGRATDNFSKEWI